MKATDKLGLMITTEDTWNDDDVKETIVSYGNNFQEIENYFLTQGNGLASVTTGKIYPLTCRLWNSQPKVGEPIGWVNIREGAYANPRKQNTNYPKGSLVASVPDNSYYYECISAGRTPNRTKPFKNTSDPFYDVTGVQLWRPNQTYDVDELVMARDGDQTYYMQCTKTGMSGSTEPIWKNHVNGPSVVDGSITWNKEANPRGHRKSTSALFKPFGVIYDEGV